ncbi:MAG: sugar phosphate isomerase/epimerase [bacterium]|nr:sugar phosphate isomerase/epimerase [bacterium]
MKIGINQWAFGTRNLAESFKLAKQAGFEAIEVNFTDTGEITAKSTKADMQKIKRLAARTGIEISSMSTGLFWRYSFTSDKKEEREQAKKNAMKLLELASYMEVSTVLIVPGHVWSFAPEAGIIPYDIAYDRSLKAISELAPIAEQYQVNIGLEHVWSKFLLSPLEFRDFIDKVGSNYVGAYFDVGNVLLYGFPEQWIRILGKRIKAVHFKDFKIDVGTIHGFVPLLYGDVNWPEVMQAFGEVGYNGYVTAEIFPPKHHAEQMIFDTAAAMRRIIGRK